MDAISANWRLVAWMCALGLVTGLIGCQSAANKAPALPPSPPLAAPSPRPAPVRTTFYVTIKQLNLRTCPRLDCPKISTLELNTEVEKMGEIDRWTQIKVRKNGAIGYVSSRYLSQHPVAVAQLTRKKLKKAEPRKPSQTPEAAKEEVAGPQNQEPSSPPSEPAGPKIPRVM